MWADDQAGSRRRQPAVVQRAGHQPGVRAGSAGALQVVGMADAAGADQLRRRRARAHLAQRVEVGPASAPTRSSVITITRPRPQLGVVPAAGRVEPLAVAPVERQHARARPRRMPRAAHRSERSDSLPNTGTTRAGRRADALAQRGRARRVGKAGVEPQLQRGHALAAARARRRPARRRPAARRGRPRTSGSMRSGGTARAPPPPGRCRRTAGDHRAVGLAVAAHRAHHLPSHQVDHGNQHHDGAMMPERAVVGWDIGGAHVKAACCGTAGCRRGAMALPAVAGPGSPRRARSTPRALRWPDLLRARARGHDDRRDGRPVRAPRRRRARASPALLARPAAGSRCSSRGDAGWLRRAPQPARTGSRSHRPTGSPPRATRRWCATHARACWSTSAAPPPT